MPSQERYGIDPGTNARRYAGEEYYGELLLWLNETEASAGKRRVLAILEAYVEVQRVFRGERSTAGGAETRKTQLGPSLRRLKRLLRRYAYFPMLFPGIDDLGSTWLPASKQKKYSHGWDYEYDDYAAVFALSALADLQLLRRLRNCDCSRWFYARFEHQRFCCAKCRERAFRTRPDEKEKRREWARKYYWLQKHANVK